MVAYQLVRDGVPIGGSRVFDGPPPELHPAKGAWLEVEHVVNGVVTERVLEERKETREEVGGKWRITSDVEDRRIDEMKALAHQLIDSTIDEYLGRGHVHDPGGPNEITISFKTEADRLALALEAVQVALQFAAGDTRGVTYHNKEEQRSRSGTPAQVGPILITALRRMQTVLDTAQTLRNDLDAAITRAQVEAVMAAIPT